jgi:tRNA 2-thiouridine synthesizing protein E
MPASTAERVAPQFDEDGLLANPEAWSEELAREIARREGLGELGPEHWEVIRALREHYSSYGVAPAMSQVCRRHHKDRHWVHDLFQTCLNAWRVAGLPNPGEEAKSYLSGT